MQTMWLLDFFSFLQRLFVPNMNEVIDAEVREWHHPHLIRNSFFPLFIANLLPYVRR